MMKDASMKIARRMLILILALCVATLASAQQGGGGGGGGGGRGGRGGTGTFGQGGLGPTMQSDAVIQYDPETDSIIVITDDETNTQISKVIQTMDRPVPQVLIKVLFLEVTHSNDLDLGIEANFSYDGYGADTNKSMVDKNGIPVQKQVRDAATGKLLFDSAGKPVMQQIYQSVKNTVGTNFGEAAAAATGHGGFYRILDKDLQVTLHALANVGKLNVLSRPSILTRNNETATITVGQEVPFIDNSRITDNGQTINTIRYDAIGIILEVTPHITSERLVAMDVAPEISTLTADTVPISETVNARVIALRSAQTSVVVADGRTVVIGGLMEDQMTDSVDKVPWLGDIPYVGALFRRTVQAKTKTELLIFLTPYVVDTADQLQTLSVAENNRAELPPQDFTKDQLNKFIDNLNPPTGGSPSAGEGPVETGKSANPATWEQPKK